MINWITERAPIAAASAIHRVDPDFIESIRAAENGAPGREFGVLSTAADTYDEQLRVACVSVAHRLSEFQGNPIVFIHDRARYSINFVRWFSGKWAPAGAENDPDGLNANWFRDAFGAYTARIRAEVESKP